MKETKFITPNHDALITFEGALSFFSLALSVKPKPHKMFCFILKDMHETD